MACLKRRGVYCGLLVAVLLGGLLLLGSCEQPQPPQRPNILILQADQWRAQSFGYAGNPDIITPNIDRLARKSANFRLATSILSVCTPQRAALLTGQRPLTNGVFMNDVQLDTSALTIAEVLAENGYQTGYIGKWHLDGRGRTSFTPPGPRRQGFQYWKAVEVTHDYNHSAYYSGSDSTKRFWKGYDAIAQARDAQRYIRDHARGDQPFFLMLSWGPPHAPYHTAPQKYKTMYDADSLWLRPNVPDSMQRRARRDLSGYYAHATALDDMVGQIRETLQKQGIADDTVLLFTSDHGDLLGSHGAYKKQQPYDESIQVPMLFHYAGGNEIQAGPYNAMINTQDIMPTLLGIAGVDIPESVEGDNYSGYLRGGESPPDTAAAIKQIQPFGQWDRPNDGGREYRGIRTPRYTYVEDLNGPWYLFDNKADPYQMNNLVGNPTHATLQRKLDTLLQKKLKKQDDKFLPGPAYVEMYDYPALDKTGTVPYTP